MAGKEKEIINKEDDLLKNPFVALFPSVQHAREYINSTKTNVVSESFKGSSSIDEWNKRSLIINDFLQRTFLFTVSSEKRKDAWKNYGGAIPSCVLLKGSYKELKEKKKSFLLDSQNLNQALMERLSLSRLHIVSYSKQSHQIDSVSGADEQLYIKYLAHSHERLNDEISLLNRKLKDLPLIEELEKLKSECESLIFSYAGSILLSPDIFETIKPHKQFIDLLLKPHDCKYLKEFLDGMIEKHSDADDLFEMLSPVMVYLMENIKSVSLIGPTILTILDLLLYFSKIPKLAKLLVNDAKWMPQRGAFASSTAGLDFERNTLLGPIIGATTLSYDADQPSEYFMDPSRQLESDIAVVTNNCRRQLDIICNKLHQIFRNLLENKELYHDVMYWIGACLHENRKRAQLAIHTALRSTLTQARDGFFINMSCVMLKLCQPFIDLPGNPSKLLKVNSRYCAIVSCFADIGGPDASSHLVQSTEDSRLAQRPEEMEPVEADGMQFKFVTECFFLTHRCLKLGYLKAASTYESLMKKLQKLSSLYQDARTSDLPGPELEKIKTEFEANIRRQLSFKAHLLNSTTAEAVLRFCAGTSYWFNQQLIAGDQFNDGNHRDFDIEAIADEVHPALTIIPEYILENVADCLIFLSHFGGEILEKSEYIMEQMMICLSLFFGSSKRTNNPHLRAKLAEALAGLLPRNRSDDLGALSMRLGARIFETNKIIAKVLPEALLKLFVDVEFTGDSMEFEQKFGYRHHMYAILEYIWNLENYKSAFFDLLEEGKATYRDKAQFSTFPRFINLLMNDCTFLLDEALEHLQKIRDLEQEKLGEEWLKLPPRARQEKERSLHEFGEMSRGYNIMALETVHVLSYVTADTAKVFTNPCMVEPTASFLNYFLMRLVGPKRKELIVKDFEKYHFKPKELVKNIAIIIVNLAPEEDFSRAIASDGRSYSPELYTQAYKVLQQIRLPSDFLERFRYLSVKFEESAKETKEQEENAPEPPEEFLDPILGNLMREPVLLPSSKTILDRSTIARHLLSDPKDPFNRSPLTLDQVVPQDELAERIFKWMDENGLKRQSGSTSEDCSG